MAASLATASCRLAPWVRWRSDVTIRSPLLELVAPWRRRRSLTASGHGLRAMLRRASHLVDSLLTFWPPEPDEREYESVTQSSFSSTSADGGCPSCAAGVKCRSAAGASAPCWT